MKKYKNKIVMITGFMIIFIMAIISISDSYATDLLSAIPVSIFGASLFVAGYVADALEK